jgi:hypothetical protein
MTRLACETISNLQWINAGLAAAAALFWLWGSVTKVPNSQDHFIAALQKQSTRNVIAALFAAAAAALQGFLIAQPSCLHL